MLCNPHNATASGNAQFVFNKSDQTKSFLLGIHHIHLMNLQLTTNQFQKVNTLGMHNLKHISNFHGHYNH